MSVRVGAGALGFPDPNKRFILLLGERGRERGREGEREGEKGKEYEMERGTA